MKKLLLSLSLWLVFAAPALAQKVHSGAYAVNCTIGCAGGTFNNNADAVVTSSTNGQTAAWLYAFNGTTWDRLQVDGSKRLKAIVDAGTGWGVADTTAFTEGTTAFSPVGGYYKAAPTNLTTGQGGTARLTPERRLQTTNGPTTDPTVGITPTMSTAVESGHVICSAACNLYQLVVTSDSTAGWLEIFDATAVPSDGTITPGATSLVVPPIAIAANTTISLDNSRIPQAYVNGLSVAYSSTGGLTKTATAHALFGWMKK